VLVFGNRPCFGWYKNQPESRNLPQTVHVHVMATSLYDVLGVTPDASLTLIRAAYKARIRETHPDNGGSQEEASSVNAAFEVLGDEFRRADYDASLAHQHSYQVPPVYEPAPRQQTTEPATATPQSFRRTPRALVIKLVVLCILWLCTVGYFASAATQNVNYLPVGSVAIWAGCAVFMVLALRAFAGRGRILRAFVLAPLITILVSSALGTGNDGSYAVLFTFIYSVVAGLWVRREMSARAQIRAETFWEKAELHGNRAWFIVSAEPDGGRTQVLLADPLGEGHDVSAVLWGVHEPGSLVATSIHPGQIAAVTATLSHRDLKLISRTSAKQPHT
jgi:hypothetical protein